MHPVAGAPEVLTRDLRTDTVRRLALDEVRVSDRCHLLTEDVNSLIIVAQLGSTIAIGLLLDTLMVRSLLMPSIATLLGRWFWWPQVVYPAATMTGPSHPPTTPPTPTTLTTPTP